MHPELTRDSVSITMRAHLNREEAETPQRPAIRGVQSLPGSGALYC